MMFVTDISLITPRFKIIFSNSFLGEGDSPYELYTEIPGAAHQAGLPDRAMVWITEEMYIQCALNP